MATNAGKLRHSSDSIRGSTTLAARRESSSQCRCARVSLPWYFFLGYAAFACVVTYPLVWHLSSTVLHDLGDPLLSTTLLWWNAHTLPLTERWWNGFAFWPATGMLAFSDHRLGEGLIATPLQWLGASPITAYNLTLLATFPLCAIAAHWLAFTLTARHDASSLCGLAFGFCPFRIAHLPHLELLTAFGMPAALAALHLYKRTRRRRWLWLFGLAIFVQGLCSSYYLLFFAVLLVLWLLWFIRRDDTDVLNGVLVAGSCAIVALLPLALRFQRIHSWYGFARPFDEILRYSADVTSFLTAHSSLRLWGWTARWSKSECELFPGATIALVALLGVILASGRDRTPGPRSRLGTWLWPAAAVLAALAACGWAYGPWRVAFAGISASSDAPFKPMTVALLAIAVAVGTSRPMRGAYARQSTLAFYGLATVMLLLCSLGPRPTLAGHQFMYEPPYAWLMRLPIFSSIRVPARFGLLAMLTLATTGALAFARFRFRPAVGAALAAALALGIAADGWPSTMTLPPLPDAWPPARAAGFAAVLELPLGDTFADFAATYRAISHRRPIVNGASGFEPTHYFTLKTALAEHDPSAFDGLPASGRVLVVVDRRDPASEIWERFLTAHPRVTRLAADPPWAFYALDPPPVEPVACDGEPARIVSITANHGTASLSMLTDGDPHTWWATPHPQRSGDNLVLDLGRTVRSCAVVVGVGEFRISYARKLIVETSTDGGAWTVVAVRRMAGLTMKAALDNPKQVAVAVPLALSTARFVRLRLDEAHPQIAWTVTEVAVRTARESE